MEKIANNLVNLIGSANPEFSELQLKKMEYGLVCFFCEITKLIPYYILFYLFNVHIFFIISLIFLSPLRAVTGGYHSKTYWGCFVLSLLIFTGIIFSGKNLDLSTGVIIAVLSASFILILAFSPVDNENKRIKSQPRKMSLKRSSLIVLALLTMMLYFLPVKYTATAVMSISAAVILMMVGFLSQFNKA